MPCVPKASALLAPMLMMILPSGGAPLRMFGAASPAANAVPAAKKLRRVGIDQFPFEDGIAEHVDKGRGPARCLPGGGKFWGRCGAGRRFASSNGKQWSAP